jgi:hypothetical protein
VKLHPHEKVEKHFSSPTHVSHKTQHRIKQSVSPFIEHIVTMGCTTSKHTIHSWGIDDSVHVALKRDSTKKGNAPKCYMPRAPHPLFMAKLDDSTMKTSYHGSDDDAVNSEAERILYHTAHHCDTIDPRDLNRSQSTRVK